MGQVKSTYWQTTDITSVHLSLLELLLFQQYQQKSHSQMVSSLTAQLRDVQQELREKEEEKKEAKRAWQNSREDWGMEERKLRDNLEKRDKLIEVNCRNTRQRINNSYLIQQCLSLFCNSVPFSFFDIANPVGCWGAGPSVQRAAAEPAEQTRTSHCHQTHTLIKDVMQTNMHGDKITFCTSHTSCLLYSIFIVVYPDYIYCYIFRCVLFWHELKESLICHIYLLLSSLEWISRRSDSLRIISMATCQVLSLRWKLTEIPKLLYVMF